MSPDAGCGRRFDFAPARREDRSLANPAPRRPHLRVPPEAAASHPHEDLFQRASSAVESRYRLERELGRGATAAVFLARDLKHERLVALKVLLPELAASLGTDRFLREIRLAARLAHPHILPVLDSGTAGELPFYVMPYVEGETLRELLARQGSLAIDIAVNLARDVADALDYAHAAGIVHRDVKPGNILLLGGHAVLADFGIARAMVAAAGQHVTGAGMAVGTPAYMSPEQAAGDDAVDGRSDQYSLAIVVFEALVGYPPFAGGTTQAMIARRFVERPPAVRTLRADASEALEDALSRAMALDPADRFADIREFATALTPGGERTVRVSPPTATRAAPVSAVPSVAVLPFANGSTDPEMEFFSDGMTDEIVGSLSRLRNLRVAARSSSYAARSRHEDARAIGERLGVGAILEGSVRRAGTRVRVNAFLVDARTGFQLWSDQYDREIDDVFAIQEEIATRIVETLRVQLLGNAARPIAASTTTNAAAYDAYLRGRYFVNQRTEAGLRRSLDQFRGAIEADPGYASAYAGLAEALALLGLYGVVAPREAMPQAAQRADEALQHDPALAEAYVTLGMVRALYDFDWPRAEDAFRRAIALSPRYPAAHQRYAIDCLAPQRRFGAAMAEIDQACQLEPLSPVLQASAGMIRYFAGDLDAAIAMERAAAASDGGFAMAEFFLGTMARDAGDMPTAYAAFQRAIALTGGTPEMIAGLARAHAGAGQQGEAERLRAQLADAARDRFVSPCLLAQIDLALGRVDSALDGLELAMEVRDPELAYLVVRPVYRELAGQERFVRLCRALDLPLIS